MHQFDQFKQDMEKLSKADLQNPIKSKQPGKPKLEYAGLPDLRITFCRNCGEQITAADKVCPICGNTIVPERSYLDATELNRTGLKPTNLYQFDDAQIFANCTVLTIDGVPGFAWYDPATGQRHDEGFTWPTMQIHKDATVEVLFGPDGERSAGWKKENE